MSTSELDARNVAVSMRKSVENLVVSSGDAIGQSISQALTFSNVLAHHAHSSTRSISRSPSPSLRSAESGGDVLDNDKAELAQFQGLAHTVADAVSVSSSSDIAAPVGKGDGNKSSTINPSTRGGDAAVRTKKKSWYNALYPTYKSKSDDFKRIFKDLPEDERLIVDYSCALQKDILAHGRLYASQNYLCFYASIFGWETNLALRWKDVTAITKEKTALVIPNAILVCTEGEKNFLTSFSGRDKAYLMLFRIWQNALMDQPMTSHEIWQWVHSCYGEELGFNSDEEGYSRDCRDLIGFPLEAVPDSVSEVELLDSSMETGTEAGEGRQRSVSRTRDHSPPLVANGNGASAAGDSESARVRADRDSLPTDMSDTSDSDHDKPHSGDLEKCASQHEGKKLLQQGFPFNIDQLFTMIFTNCKFNLELLAARGTTDYVQGQWQQSAGVKGRQVSYDLSLNSGAIGPSKVHVTETQVMHKCSKPGHLYSIDVSSENTGIPYADYFTVEAHYCLRRTSENSTDLTIYGHVKYKKSMFSMVKAFIEKNTMSGMSDYCRLIADKLTAEASGVAPVRKTRRHRRATALTPETLTASIAAPILAPRVAPRPAGTFNWLSGILVLLLLINVLLYSAQLYHKEWRPILPDDLEARMNALSDEQMADWSVLLAKHTVRQRGQMQTWRHALQNTVRHLKQTEDALRTLLETIEPSLERAQQEAESPPDLKNAKDTSKDAPMSRNDAAETSHQRKDEL